MSQAPLLSIHSPEYKLFLFSPRIKANSAAPAFTLSHTPPTVTVNTRTAVCLSSHRPRPDAPLGGKDPAGQTLTGPADPVPHPLTRGHLIEL